MRPKREHATENQQTYMITTSTWGRRDPVPQGLKPQVMGVAVGAAEAAPFQNRN
jgi:hypothetical protein